MKCIHIYKKTVRQLYVVPVYTKEGKLFFEIAPVVIVDVENNPISRQRLADAIRIASDTSERDCKKVGLGERWDGLNGEVWRKSSMMISVVWTSTHIFFEECLPVLSDNYPLPGFDRIEAWKLEPLLSNKELAECILADFIFDDLN